VSRPPRKSSTEMAVTSVAMDVLLGVVVPAQQQRIGRV
jgi:hypothetical protein